MPCTTRCDSQTPSQPVTSLEKAGHSWGSFSPAKADAAAAAEAEAEAEAGAAAGVEAIVLTLFKASRLAEVSLAHERGADKGTWQAALDMGNSLPRPIPRRIDPSQVAASPGT